MDKTIKGMYKEPLYAETIRKLYTDTILEQNEAEYILGCAMLLLMEYSKTKNEEYFETAYNIVLKYCTNTGDYRALYHVASNYGLYPISRFIDNNELVGVPSIEDMFNYVRTEKYKNGNYIETYEQHKVRNEIIHYTGRALSFIAPTSAGKSSVIVQHLIENSDIDKAIIIVPTKSLISQTYMEMREKIRDRKVLRHEAMYSGERRFVGVLTQERTLRFLEKNKDVAIDCVYIDEAHNILDNSDRSVLLSRAITLCKERNGDIKLIYLSPFVNDSENLIQDNDEKIDEKRININVKEPNISVLTKDGGVRTYNRFANSFYDLGYCDNYYKYISENCKHKNFFFIQSPRKIEKFAEELYNHTGNIQISQQTRELINILKRTVHSEFSAIKYLEHGIIYLHAKMPDPIKEFLEYQFKTNNDIRYLIANVVIMEGINLPIDTLFVLDVRGMNGPELKNLMGRVNRLNNVFDMEKGDLSMLRPEIHFLSSDYCSNDMEKKIKEIYKKTKDIVHNPLLHECSLEDLRNKEKLEKERKKNQEILLHESLLREEPQSELAALRKKLISSGINQLIEINDRNVETIAKRLKTANWMKSIIEIVSEIFVADIDVKDSMFSRLKMTSAVNFYKFFIEAAKKYDIFHLIGMQVNYWQKVKAGDKPYMYVGDSYGEIAIAESSLSLEINKKMKPTYVDLTEKSSSQIVNLIVVKTKIEQDFISFQYSRVVNFLHDEGYIDDKRFNLEMYGTQDEKKIEMLNMGIPIGVLNLIEKNNQLKNIRKDSTGNLSGNRSFFEFADQQDAYWRYAIKKCIVQET